MAFLKNIFSLDQDSGSWLSHLAGIAGVLAATPAGAKFVGLAAAQEEVSWAWALGGTVLYFLGARGGQPNAR